MHDKSADAPSDERAQLEIQGGLEEFKERWCRGCTILGDVQAQKAAELLMDIRVSLEN